MSLKESKQHTIPLKSGANSEIPVIVLGTKNSQFLDTACCGGGAVISICAQDTDANIKLALRNELTLKKVSTKQKNMSGCTLLGHLFNKLKYSRKQCPSGISPSLFSLVDA